MKMVQIFFRAKRRLKNIYRKKKVKQAIKISYFAYQVSKIIYNPFRILDIVIFNNLIKN
tara:strand:- start:1289 stop:1465 length:177 start_codon:yes stop_codon:yes gene_type:complete